MRNDSIILQDGMVALRNSLGLVDSEKFIALVLREKFDYTEWQRNLWNDESVSEIHKKAEKYYHSREQGEIVEWSK